MIRAQVFSPVALVRQILGRHQLFVIVAWHIPRRVFHFHKVHKAMSPFIPNPKIIVGSLALLFLGHVSHYHAEAMSTNTGTPRSRTGNGTPRTSNTKNQKPTYYNYFAFGSNMASSTMTALRSLDPVASTAAILPNHRLAFNVPGTRHGLRRTFLGVCGTVEGKGYKYKHKY